MKGNKTVTGETVGKNRKVGLIGSSITQLSAAEIMTGQTFSFHVMPFKYSNTICAKRLVEPYENPPQCNDMFKLELNFNGCFNQPKNPINDECTLGYLCNL